MSVLEELFENMATGVEGNEKIYEFGEKIKEFKILWNIRNNDIWSLTSKYVHDHTFFLQGKFQIGSSDSFKENNYLGFDTTQNILFNKSKLNNKEKILDYVKKNYNTAHANIQRNLNVYWLERVSKLFDTCKEEEKYNTKGYFDKELFEKDKLKVQLLCCDMLFSGSNKDYENIKYFAKAIKQKKSIDYLENFMAEGEDNNGEIKVATVREIKQKDLMTDYIAIQEPTRSLIAATAVVAIGLVSALALPPFAGYIASTLFVLKVKDVTKSVVTLLNKAVKYEGADLTDPFYNLNRVSGEWNGNEIDKMHVVLATMVKNDFGLKNVEINEFNLKLGLGLSEDNISIVKAFAKASDQQKMDYSTIRNPDLRMLYARAFTEQGNGSEILSSIKNLDSLLTVRSMEDFSFKEFDLKSVIFDDDNSFRKENLAKVVQESYYVAYDQANLISSKTDKMLFRKSYTNGAFDIVKFNSLITDECSDLIENIGFTKLLSRGLKGIKTLAIDNLLFKEGKEVEVKIENKNKKLEAFIKKMEPDQYFKESIESFKITTVDSTANVGFDCKEEPVDPIVYNRINCLTEELRKREVNIKHRGNKII